MPIPQDHRIEAFSGDGMFLTQPGDALTTNGTAVMLTRPGVWMDVDLFLDEARR